MVNTLENSAFLKSIRIPIVCIFMFFPNLQNHCLNKFKNTHSSRVKWSNLWQACWWQLIKNVEFIKEYRQSVLKELLKDREESSYVKTEKP